MEINIDMLILCIDNSDLTEDEKYFLIKNIKNINDHFEQKFKHQIYINI